MSIDHIACAQFSTIGIFRVGLVQNASDVNWYAVHLHNEQQTTTIAFVFSMTLLKISPTETFGESISESAKIKGTPRKANARADVTNVKEGMIMITSSSGPRSKI